MSGYIDGNAYDGLSEAVQGALEYAVWQVETDSGADEYRLQEALEGEVHASLDRVLQSAREAVEGALSEEMPRIRRLAEEAAL